ncbi:ribosomal protein L37AE/L43A [Brevibacillus nitrificans]|nr:ribosomal protein L37AE/L43A [Brevibacillus nitrificans]
MVQKWCAQCKNHSFSSGDGFIWICPHCGKDLTLQKAVPAVIRFVLIRSFFPHQYQRHGRQLNRHDENTA